MQVTVEANEQRLQRILRSLECARENAPEEWQENLTSYWRQHLTAVRLESHGNGRVTVAGESGFYFPGNTYSGPDLLNTLDRWVYMRRLRTEARRRRDPRLQSVLRLGIPQTSHAQRFGYPIAGRRLSYDFLRSVFHAYSILAASRDAGIELPDAPVTLEIGPGTGFMALTFSQIYPQGCYVLVDLPQMLPVSSLFLSMHLPDRRFVFYDELLERRARGEPVIQPGDNLVFVPHYEVGIVPDASCDLAINTDSMQEMTLDTIRSYFTHLRRVLRGPRLFYQSNRRLKVMDGVGIAPDKFPYVDADRHVLDRENGFMAASWVTRKLFRFVPYPKRKTRSHVQRLTRLA